MIADIIAKALGGRKAGNGWTSRCPAHDDRNPSLSISATKAGKVLLHCHAGCNQAQVIDALRSRGLWDFGAEIPVRRRSCKGERRRDKPPGQKNAGAAQYALSIWQNSIPVQNTLAESYLQSRGLRLALPSTLRFQSRLKHSSGDLWPALVALVSRGSDNEPLAIHRTFLARDGSGKAPINPQKMMLGPCGGGAVRLGEPTNVLMVGEGIETCLTAMQATGDPAWAALSTSGLKALNLPENVREVIVLADGDDAGEAAARQCALRWRREGRQVRIARPPCGQDFNDMLLCPAPQSGEDQ